MKKILIIMNSTIAMVLFCFSDIKSLPLTKTCYTPSENKIDMLLKEEFIYIDSMNRKDNYSFNLGMPSNSSIGFDFSLINYDSLKVGENKPGDILFNLWHFTGSYFDGAFETGLSVVVRIPTGQNAYNDEKCRNLSFGNSELKFTPVFSFNVSSREILLLNPGYTFREASGENLYSGFRVNPLNRETYKSCLGLNPFYQGSFLEGKRLKNDYASISAGAITSRLYPSVFFIELYYSSRLYRGKEDLMNISIEGDRVSPFLLSVGGKYFFSSSFFFQISDIFTLIGEDGYIKNTAEFGLNIFF